MSRTTTSARTAEMRNSDVLNLVKAARSVVALRSSLIALISESTGLSRAGVELALTKHVETNPTDEDLRLLVERAGDASKVVVILSSNVFVGALRAIAIARAASDDVIVRPSRRDPAFARALVEAAKDPCIKLDDDVDIANVEHGEVHIYGRDETIAEMRARARPGVRVRGHGAGMGIAWITSRVAGGESGASSGGATTTSIEDAARGLAEDVVVFDQRGCLSPRLALVEGDLERAGVFAEALHAELERLDLVVPRGPLPTEERAASDRYVATMTYACRALVGTRHAIGIAPPKAPIISSPAYRHVHLAACPTREDAIALIAPVARSIIAVGSDDLEQARLIAPPWARVSTLGQMQRPPLDGPVDLRED